MHKNELIPGKKKYGTFAEGQKTKNARYLFLKGDVRLLGPKTSLKKKKNTQKKNKKKTILNLEEKKTPIPFFFKDCICSKEKI